MLFEEIEGTKGQEAIRKRTREFEIAFQKYLDPLKPNGSEYQPGFGNEFCDGGGGGRLCPSGKIAAACTAGLYAEQLSGRRLRCLASITSGRGHTAIRPSVMHKPFERIENRDGQAALMRST